MHVRITESWKIALATNFEEPYFETLSETIKTAYLQGSVFPPPKQLFKAFELCPFNQVKVVILGQDPYHGPGQAHGLAFSVPDGVRTPPSLKNIYKELQTDLGIPGRVNGNLESWATQGVLLLNATLTVLPGQPGSHQGLGWETFTDNVIKTLSDKKEHLVFILWGNFARAKAGLINRTKHLVLTAPHPSPFSAYTGFFGCRHFSLTNSYLKEHSQTEITW